MASLNPTFDNVEHNSALGTEVAKAHKIAVLTFALETL